MFLINLDNVITMSECQDTEMRALVSENLEAFVNVGFLDAEYDGFILIWLLINRLFYNLFWQSYFNLVYSWSFHRNNFKYNSIIN